MNKLWVLLRIQLLSAFGINKAIHSKDKKEKKKLIRLGLLMVFVSITVIFSVFVYDFLFGEAFYKLGLPELMPAMMMTAASIVTLFTTIYKVNGLIVGFKDFDMTMAMPIKTSVIVASRLLILYLMNLGFCLLINVPAAIVYSYFVKPPITFYPFMLILTFFVPMVPILIGTVAGIIISAIASRFRRVNILSIILTLALILGIMACSFALPSIINSAEQMSKTIMDTVYSIYPLTKMYTNALCSSDVTAFILFVIISLVLFFVFSLIIGTFFKRLNTSLTTIRTRSNYHITTLHTSSAVNALYKRELRRYFASSLYVINTGFGMILLLIMSIALLFLKPEQLESLVEIPGIAHVVGTMAPMALSIMVCMSCTTSCSISLEGKHLWIIKSLPIKADTIFLSKILVNLTVTIPLSIISGVILAVSIPMNTVQIILLFLTPAAFAVLSAVTGLYINLLYPNFTWTSETVVIKQSLPTLLSTIGGMILTVGLVVGLIQIPKAYQLTALVILTFIVAIADIIFIYVLKNSGERKFNAL